MESNLEDDVIFLVCTNPNSIEESIPKDEICISTAESSSWDLPTILSHGIVNVQSNRNRLIQHSSYFRSLICGNFSESCHGSISILWNLEAFINILRFIYGCSLDVTPQNFIILYEGALFFGVDALLLKCKIWLSELDSSKGPLSLQIQLDDLIHIWNFGEENGNDFIPEICTGYLARNFMWAMSCNSFPSLPYGMLIACTRHPELTVDSEKHLSDALLVWLAANTELSECSSCMEDRCIDVLKQIRIKLLPLWFSAGKKRCYIFKFADESINAILSLVKHPSTSSVIDSGDKDLSQLRIRLTKYTKKVDISGCPQITFEILLLSLIPCSYIVDSELRKSIEQSLINLKHLNQNQYAISAGLLPILNFEAVQEVDISKCSRLHLEAAIECFCKSFPALRILRASYLSNFKMSGLRQLVKCSLLSEVDFTVDVSPVIPLQVSIISSSQNITPKIPTKFVESENYILDTISFSLSRSLLSNITKLTLEGRTDVSDSDLQDISEFCPFLCHLNLKACTSVTDTGMSILIRRCIKLQSILVCDTSFGRNSILALCCSIPDSGNSAAVDFGKRQQNSVALNLQTLHMGGCKGVDETSLLEVLSQVQTLRSLCLRETHLVDNALFSFSSSSLEMLVVDNTMVSGSALAYVVRGNPGIKCLKARGCKNLFQKESTGKGKECSSLSPSCRELYLELSKACKLEEFSIGWGFSHFSLEALGPAITSLKKIKVGLGASLSHDALTLLPKTCPFLESVVLYFQVITDCIMTNIMRSLRNLQVLVLCYCLGDISSLSFKFSMPNLRRLRLVRVTPWMTNDDLVILTRNCVNLVELSLLGCRLLNSDSQQIISHGWPGLTSIHLEDCGEVTADGVASLFDCKALEDLLLRHNGRGIQKNFILDAASKMPMLRKVSLDFCDAVEGYFNLPNYADRCSLSIVKMARCKTRKCAVEIQILGAFRRPVHEEKPVHKETLVFVWSSKNLTRTVVKERI